MTDIIQLDGGYLEGGGQIVRNALALSCLTGKPFEVSDIRKGRCDAGLKAQHLHCVKAAAQLCDAKFDGAEIGSTRLKFFPGKLKARPLNIDVGTAGSVTLLMQAILIPAMFSDSTVKLKLVGGTDVKWSMPVDYFKEVFLPHLTKYASTDFKLVKRGYFPSGNGIVEMKIEPQTKLGDFKNFDDFHKYLREQTKIDLIEQGKIVQVKGVSHASKQLESAKVAERQAAAARLSLSQLKCPISIAEEYSDALSPGSGITIYAIFSKSGEIDFNNPIRLGADGLGEKGLPAEKVSEIAVNGLLDEINSGAPVDSHMADNLIPFLGLFGGRIKVAQLTNHALTNIYVTEKFLNVKFEVDKIKKIVSCNI